MAGEPVVTVVGHLAADPDVAYTPNDTPYCRFAVACTPQTRDQDGNWVDGTTLWAQCQAWSFLAERIGENFTKGDRVIVSGRMVQEEWENDEGEKRSMQRILVDNIGADIRFADVTIAKRSKRDSGPAPEGHKPKPKAKAKPASKPKASTRPKPKAKAPKAKASAAAGDLF